MLAKLRSQMSYANVMASVAVFVALGAGAYAAGLKPDSVKSKHIVDDQVKSADVRDDSLQNGGLTGPDIVESSLGEVPSATLGGLGGDSAAGGPCNPESAVFTTCATVSTTLPAPSRVLIIGQIRAEPDTGGGNGGGQCGVAEPVLRTIPVFVNGGQTDVITISGVTGLVGPGPVSFGMHCNEEASGIRYFDGRLSFVALSPSAAP